MFNHLDGVRAVATMRFKRKGEIVMFSDPIVIANSGTALTLPRVDAGLKSGRYMKVVPGTSTEEFNIRNSEYFSKPLKRTMSRHNIELTRIKSIAATSTEPSTTSVVKAYLVIEHDVRATSAEIAAAADEVANFVIATKNSGYVTKLINNEG